LRAGQTVKIFFGENVLAAKTHLRVDLESISDKTLVFYAPNPDGQNSGILRHMKVGKIRHEFDLTDNQGETGTFDELHISASEDTQFQFGVYLKA
jgi:hypothetical protein